MRKATPIGRPWKRALDGFTSYRERSFWIPISDATCVKEDLSIVSKPPALHQSQVDQLTIHLEQLHAAMECRLVGVAAPSTGWLGTTWSNHPCEALPRGDPKTLPQGDAKGEPDMKEGRGPIDNGSDRPVPKVPEGKEEFIPTKLSMSPHLDGLRWGLPPRDGSGQVGSHLPPKKYEVPVRISSGYETLTSAPSTSSMLMTAWFSCATKFTSCQKPSFRRYPRQERRVL